MKSPATIAIAWLALLVADEREAFDAGLAAYRAARYAEAAANFETLTRGPLGDSKELWFAHALAALRAGELETAASATERFAELGGGVEAARAEFLRGCVVQHELQRSLAAANEGAASREATMAALALAQRSREAFVLAVTRGGNDWPEARRNAERLELTIADLAQRLAANEDVVDEKRTLPREVPIPLPLPATERDDAEPREVEPELAAETPRSDAELLRLLELLERREREKLASRRAAREARSDAVERDW
jgi:hypothetical protein